MYRRILSLGVISLALLLVCLTLATTPTVAQGPKPKSLQYDESATDEITELGKEVLFEFAGKKGDFAIVQLLPDVDKALIGATLKVLDGKNKTIADSTKLIVFGQLGEIVLVEVTNDDAFSISVSLTDSGTPGGFEVIVRKAQLLELDQEINGMAVSAPKGKRVQYTTFYAVDSRDDVSLVYTPELGDYVPAVIVLSTEAGNSLFPAAYLGGRALTGGSLRIPGGRAVTIVGIGDLGFGNPGRDVEKTAKYTIKMTAAQ